MRARHVETQSLRRGARLRPHPPAHRRHRADRRRRSGVHGARSGGDLLPRVPPCRVRHLRAVAVELDGEDRAGRFRLCGRAGLRVARVPPHLDLCAHRPREEAGGPEGPQGRRRRISAHRERVGARAAGGRVRREALRHPLDQGRAGAGGPRRRRSRSRCRPTCKLDPAPEGATLNAMLEAGEIDAFIGPRTPSCFEHGKPNIGWLWPDPMAAAKDYFRQDRQLPDHAHDRRAPHAGDAASRGCRPRC